MKPLSKRPRRKGTQQKSAIASCRVAGANQQWKKEETNPYVCIHTMQLGEWMYWGPRRRSEGVMHINKTEKKKIWWRTAWQNKAVIFNLSQNY